MNYFIYKIKNFIFTWQVTANVWHNCVLPVLNSPKISVIEPVSKPPNKNI